MIRKSANGRSLAWHSGTNFVNGVQRNGEFEFDVIIGQFAIF
jgi:hypothetical protein